MKGPRGDALSLPSAPSGIHGRPPYVGERALRERRAQVGRRYRPGAGRLCTKVFAVRDRMIDVCSGKKNARFAAVTKWQIGVETSSRATWASANFGVGSFSPLSLSLFLALPKAIVTTYTTRMLNDFFLMLKSRGVNRGAH